MEQKKKRQTNTRDKAKKAETQDGRLDASRIKQQDWLVERFSRARSGLHKERFCFILGSGASVTSGIPSGITLEKRWIKYLLGVEDDRPNPEYVPGAIYKKRKEEGSRALAEAMYKEKKIEHDPKVLLTDTDKPDSEFYFDLYTLRFEGIKKDGHRYMEEVMEGCRPRLGYYPLAKILADKDNNMVITTNFDSLTEDALFFYTDKKPLVAGHEALAEYIDANIQRPMIAKVHRGLFTDPMNSSEATSALKEQWAKVLTDALKVYTPIVIGYGGGDRSLMDFLKTAELKNGIYWCVYGKEMPSADIQAFLMDKEGFLIKTSGFDSVMYYLGKEMYPDKMGPIVVEALLKNMLDERLDSYNKGLNKLNLNDPAQKRIADEIKEGENEREKAGQLSAWDFSRMGSRAYDAGDFAGAVEHYSKAIEKDPNTAAFFNNRGISYKNLGRYDEAIADYNRAIELKPDFAYAFNNRGVAYGNLGRYVEAIADYNRAIELKPDYAEALNNRGVAYDDLGRYDEAIADYNRAIDLKPDLADALNNRGISYKNLGRYNEAIADYNRAIELKPDDAEVLNNRGIAYGNLGRYDEAIADFNRAIELKPDYAYVFNNRGVAYGNLGRYDEAIADFNRAIELKPDYAEAYRNRASAYRAIGKPGKAKADEARADELEKKS